MTSGIECCNRVIVMLWMWSGDDHCIDVIQFCHLCYGRSSRDTPLLSERLTTLLVSSADRHESSSQRVSYRLGMQLCNLSVPDHTKTDNVHVVSSYGCHATFTSSGSRSYDR